jgi:tetratricopeptide (TPR) repeat protein
MMKKSVVFPVLPSILILILLATAFFVPPAFGQSPGSLQKGIIQYQADNYEEAVELFIKASQETPKSAEAAFWLGKAYRAQGNFQDALPHLTDAATFTPPVKEAVVELIDVLYRLERMEEANKWLAVAERDGIYPAKTAFLRGMILAKQGKYPESIVSFEKSKTLDKAFIQAADFQIGLSHMLERKYKQAAERFRAVVLQDPVSDLASYARRYQTLVEERGWIERPIRLTLSMLGQYDTNMLQEPYAHPLLPDAGDERSLRMLNTLRLDFAPILKDPWLFQASYALSGSLHEKNSTTYDFLVNSLTVAPGYNFGRFSVNLYANYMHALKRDPGYERYSDRFSTGPLARILLTDKKDQILEIYAGYQKKNFFKAPLDPNENQTADGIDSHISWMRFDESGAILVVNYGFETDNANGNNWSNQGHRLSVNNILPIWEKFKLQLGAEIFLQEFCNASTIAAFAGKKRQDKNYMGTAGLIWDIHRNLSLMVNYTGIRNDSNIYLYDYIRHIFSFGAELRF